MCSAALAAALRSGCSAEWLTHVCACIHMYEHMRTHLGTCTCMHEHICTHSTLAPVKSTPPLNTSLARCGVVGSLEQTAKACTWQHCPPMWRWQRL